MNHLDKHHRGQHSARPVSSQRGIVSAIVGLLTLLAAMVPAVSTASAATNVPVGMSNPCYAGGSLAYWDVVVDNGGKTRIFGSTGSVSYVSTGRHTVAGQAFCRYGGVIGAGRSGTVCSWVYSSGFQPRIWVVGGYYRNCV